MSYRKKIVIDCDPGIDDALALMLALSKEDIDLKAVTAIFGNVDVDKAFENIMKVMSLCKIKDIPPIAKGADVSLSGAPYRPRFVHGVDGLGNTNLKVPEIDLKPEDATELIKRVFRKDEIDTLVTLGPLTNIAKVLVEEPAIKEDIRQIVLMGGVVYAKGNATDSAEFNIYQDAEAAKIVINSKIPIKLVSLDSTRKILYTKKVLERIKHKKGSQLSEFIHKMFNFALDYHRKYRKRDGIYLPDVLAMCIVLDENLGEFKDLSLDVDIENDIGKVFINLKAENNIEFLEDVDINKAIDIFMDGINKMIG